ncbi:helix-turn-helix transcriptional regulator [Actinomadura logoneensis]|nr:helix-turn-helix transcriptional regulator [Actinomadura logoneensis]
MAAARQEILAILPADYDITGPWTSIATRLIVHGPTPPLAEEHAAVPHRQVRFSPEVPMCLIVVDRTIAWVSASKGGTHWTGITRPNAAVDSLVSLFEWLWRRAGRHAAARGQVSAVQQEILIGLAAGLTDEEIAEGLGLSTRTVQRHITTTMNLLGARSRLELGFVCRLAGLPDLPADGTARFAAAGTGTHR